MTINGTETGWLAGFSIPHHAPLLVYFGEKAPFLPIAAPEEGPRLRMRHPPRAQPVDLPHAPERIGPLPERVAAAEPSQSAHAPGIVDGLPRPGGAFALPAAPAKERRQAPSSEHRPRARQHHGGCARSGRRGDRGTLDLGRG
jgi:hypothetical protein